MKQVEGPESTQALPPELEGIPDDYPGPNPKESSHHAPL